MSNDVREARSRLIELQKLLLPAALPPIGCTEVAAAYRSHNHELDIGGDWYDLIDRPDDNSVVAIVGDVVGHGIEQIGVMGQLRSASHALCGPCTEPHEIVKALDGFARTLPGAALATVAVLVLDGTSRARLCSAGHPPALHVTSAGAADVIEVGRRAPLTIESGAVTGTFHFEVDDLIVLYTDGVIERRGSSLDEGMRALGAFVQQRVTESCRDVASAIVDDFGSGADDDQAVMVLRPLHRRAAHYRRPNSIDATVDLTAR